MWKDKILGLVVVILGFQFLACTSVPEDPQDFEKASLYGMVYDGKNSSVGHALIQLDQSFETISDINGRFSFQDVSRGYHEITITKENSETKTIAFEFMSRTEVLYVKVYSLDNYLDAAITSLASQDTKAAAEYIEKAEVIAPQDPKFLYARALYHSVLGETEIAESFLSQLDAMGIRSDALRYLRTYIAEMNRENEGGREE